MQQASKAALQNTKRLSENPKPVQRRAWGSLKALTTVASNLEKRPFDERVRTLRKTNDLVQRNIL
jgi:hypothetical protein